MEITVWGCRGSLAAPGPDTARYGGNTSCVEVRIDDGTVIILDAGTGLRPLGRKLAEEGVGRVHLLLSHLHMDHLQGLAFFKPLYDSNVELHVWGPPSPTRPLHDRIAAYMSEPLFPVNLSEVPCQAVFHDAHDDDEIVIGTARVWTSPVAHQGPTVGYRIEEGARSLVYIPDHEPAIGVDLGHLEVSWISGFGLAAGADLLLHDAQYTEDEYPDHVGWGHSNVALVVNFARVAQARQLVLFHHDPAHSDDDLERLLDRATELWGPDGNRPILAAEGMTLTLSSTAAEVAATA